MHVFVIFCSIFSRALDLLHFISTLRYLQALFIFYKMISDRKLLIMTLLNFLTLRVTDHDFAYSTYFSYFAYFRYRLNWDLFLNNHGFFYIIWRGPKVSWYLRVKLLDRRELVKHQVTLFVLTNTRPLGIAWCLRFYYTILFTIILFWYSDKRIEIVVFLFPEWKKILPLQQPLGSEHITYFTYFTYFTSNRFNLQSRMYMTVC